MHASTDPAENEVENKNKISAKKTVSVGRSGHTGRWHTNPYALLISSRPLTPLCTAESIEPHGRQRARRLRREEWSRIFFIASVRLADHGKGSGTQVSLVVFQMQKVRVRIKKARL